MFLDVVAGPQSIGLRGRDRIDRARGDEGAAVDDEQILDAVYLAKAIDHRSPRINAHACRPHQMPARVLDRRKRRNHARTGRLQHLFGGI